MSTNSPTFPEGNVGDRVRMRCDRGRLFDLQNVDALLFQQEYICEKGNDTVEGVADSEQQCDSGKRGDPGARVIQDKCNPVIDRIGDDGLKENHYFCIVKINIVNKHLKKW